MPAPSRLTTPHDLRLSLAHTRLAPLLALALVSCSLSCRAAESPAAGAEPGNAGVTSVKAPVTPEDSALTTAAERALIAWLDASAERSGRASVYEGRGCDDGVDVFPSPLLATYEVLPSSLRGDTVVARANVTTVGEQDIDRRAGDRFVARQRVRTDVLEWDVIPVEGGWRVCNGIRFGYRGADSLTSWSPEGAGIETARALADSVRDAHGAGAKDTGAHNGALRGKS